MRGESTHGVSAEVTPVRQGSVSQVQVLQVQSCQRVCVVRAPIGGTRDAVRRGQPRALRCGAVHRIVLYCIVGHGSGPDLHAPEK